MIAEEFPSARFARKDGTYNVIASLAVELLKRFLKAPFVKSDVLLRDFEERDHLGDWDEVMSHGLRISFKPKDSESEGPVGLFWKEPAPQS